MSYHQSNQAKFGFFRAAAACIVGGSTFFCVSSSIKSLQYSYQPKYEQVDCSNVTSCFTTIGGNLFEGARDLGTSVLAEASSWNAIFSGSVAAASGAFLYVTRNME
jgi:hypothetical protein